MGERVHCALFRINVNIYIVYVRNNTTCGENSRAAFSALSVRTTRRDFKGGDNSRCGEISRKYGI